MPSDNSVTLINLSHLIGKKAPFWIQGNGGNVSFKFSDTLAIKATGFRLDQVGEADSIVECRLSELREPIKDLIQKVRRHEIRNQLAEELYSQILKNSSNQGRPSMEAGFHALLPRKWVIHFHSLGALLMFHKFIHEKGRLEKWLAPFSKNISFIDFTTPGLALSEAVFEKSDADFYILQNHGVILQSEDESILGDWNDLESSFLKEWGYQAVANLTPDKTASTINAIVKNNPIGKLKIYFPDTAVFLNELKNILTQHTGNKYELKVSHFENKQALGLAESWAATRILNIVEPELSEVPLQELEKIENLPTEVFRKEKK